jgi:predicted oxidoreductase
MAAGLTRQIGVSNFSVKKLSELLPHCSIKPEMNQVELHPLLQQSELHGRPMRPCSSRTRSSDRSLKHTIGPPRRC